MANTAERKWTVGQQASISIRGKTLLVSAAAGSGKTATLTERIIRSLTDKDDPSDISKMLIVTFTRAAANELKERIFVALGKALATDPTNKHLNEQLIKLGSANICTIDSFYFNLIRQNFTALNIPATVRIGDSAELKVMKKNLMEEVIDSFYDTDDSFSSFADCFVGTKTINNLALPLLKLYDDVVAFPEGIEFLLKNAEELEKYADEHTDLFDTSYGKLLRGELLGKFEYYDLIFKNAYEYSLDNSPAFDKRAATYESDRQFTSIIYAALADRSVGYSTLKELFTSYSPVDLGSAKKNDETVESLYYKGIRTEIRNDIRDVTSKIFSRDDEALWSEMRATAYYVRKLYLLLSEFSVRLAEEKSKRNILDFDNVRRLTFKLLVNPDGTPTETAKKYREQFTDIYIDEYQDVDKVQDMIFSAIANGNRFMVGDIKQSIYGFRGAEPQVFANYRKRFCNFDPDKSHISEIDQNELTVFMSDNFRCDKNVIDFTNLVCGNIFSTCVDSIGYTKDDDLKFSKLPPSEDYVSPKVEIDVILTQNADEDDDEDDGKGNKKRKAKKGDELTADELEAEFIAEKIASLVGKEKNADGKLIVPGDIAILYRSNAMVAYLSEALRKRRILCSEGGGDEYFENPDVLLVLSLLNTIDNPHRDIHLAATLMSPLFEFTLDELIAIRLEASTSFSLYDALVEYSARQGDLAQKCKSFDETLSDLSRKSVALPVDRFLRVLFESEIFAASGLFADRNNYGEGGNLLRLYDYARTFESASFKGLYNFIEFINTLIENDQKLEVAQKSRSDDRVTLTTIHHSKGLEFPVCFICGTGRRKNMTEIYKNSMLYEYPAGVALKITDGTGFARINTPLREAISKRKFIRENEEEMRVLYVAMTRARERLYITATTKKDEETLLTEAHMRSVNRCEYSVKHCMSFLEWILMPFEHASAYECANLKFVAAENSNPSGASDEQVQTAPTKSVKADTALYETLKEKFAFDYGYDELLKIPAKLSVSKLYPDVLDASDTSFDLFDADTKTRVPDIFVTGKVSRASASERGTATHLFFQFCDFKRAEAKGADEELARLVEKRFIPENMAELIYKNELQLFTESELFAKIRNADRIVREQRFNLLFPASAFSADPALMKKLEGETLAVQGVIDLILITSDGNIELYDYKTDRLTHGELCSSELGRRKMNELHGLQLSYYAHAVSELFGKECSRIAVYSTHSGKLYDIDPIDLKLNTEI